MSVSVSGEAALVSGSGSQLLVGESCDLTQWRQWSGAAGPSHKHGHSRLITTSQQGVSSSLTSIFVIRLFLVNVTMCAIILESISPFPSLSRLLRL